MKKRLTLLLVMFCVGSLFTTELYAQSKESKKELRKRQRYEAENEQREALKGFLESKDFTFTAKEIESSGNASISNIRLNSLWYLTIKPNMLRCYLPIYGASSPTARPTLLRRMDFTTTQFEYSLKYIDEGYKGYTLEIKTRDTKTNTSYTFELDVPSNGQNVRVRISSNFNAPVTLKGDILN